MQNIVTNLKLPSIISFLLVIPLMILQVMNRHNFNEGLPIALFITMWLLPMLFIITLMPLVRNVRAGNSITASPINLVIRVVILVLIAWIWTAILLDQMPCFLGVPNCD